LTTQIAETSAPAQASSPDPFVKPLLVQIGFQRYALRRNIEGITHEESVRSPSPGGNCINWVVGHLVLTRQAWLTSLLGMAPAVDPEQKTRYRRGASPLVDGTLAMPWEELVAAFERSQAPLIEGMSRLGAQRLGEKAPFSPGNDPDETIGSLVAKLCFHEGYHIGQTGVLRRLLGRAGGIA
jgi:uncharacterized damage-inducible protein DinB